MKMIAMIAAAGLSSSAMAQLGTSLDNIQDLSGVARGTTGSTISLDLVDAESWDAQGSLNNTLLTVNIGAGNSLVSIGWNVEIATVGASWLSEPVMSFSNTTGPAGLFLTIGAGNDVAGTMTFDSGGLLDLSDNGIPNIVADADGLIHIEIFEGYDDVADAVDAILNGKLTLGIGAVPAPGAAALFGLGGLAAARRRRA